IAAAFVVSQILAIVVHGFILAADYAPYYGTLLRTHEHASWQMLLLPAAHIAFFSALVWLYARPRLVGGGDADALAPRAGRGVGVGTAGWVVGQIPLWLLWYAEQPWPGTLVVKQLGLELVSSLAIGLTIALVARERAAIGADRFARSA